MYSADHTEDLRFSIEHVRQQYPEAPILSVSWSLGANVLVRCAGVGLLWVGPTRVWK